MFALATQVYKIVVILFFSCLAMSDSFATKWTVTRQAPLSMGFPRQEYWSALSCLYPGDLPSQSHFYRVFFFFFSWYFSLSVKGFYKLAHTFIKKITYLRFWSINDVSKTYIFRLFLQISQVAWLMMRICKSYIYCHKAISVSYNHISFTTMFQYICSVSHLTIWEILLLLTMTSSLKLYHI